MTVFSNVRALVRKWLLTPSQVLARKSGTEKPWTHRAPRNSRYYALGSPEWLVACERELGGKKTNVPRNKVSPADPRPYSQIARGGMTGGDRMGAHGYAPYYSKHLETFFGRSELIVAECGILQGTGLALWSRLFPTAALFGLDIDLTHAEEKVPELMRLGAFRATLPTLLEFDQFCPDTTTLRESLKGRGINIFVDDRFHSNETILKTWEAVRSLLADRFVYFVEDNREVHKSLRRLAPDVSVFNYGELTVVESARA